MPRVPRLTWWSLAALAAGVTLGLVGNLTGLAVFARVAGIAETAGELWIAALQMIALPLVLVLTLTAISSARAESVGALGGRAVVLYAVALVALAALTLAITSLLVARYSVDSTTVTAMNAGAHISDAIRSAAASTPQGSWIDRVIPRNVFGAAVRGEMFSLLLFTILFAVAVTRLPPEQRAPLTGAFQAVAAAMMVVVGWLLAVTPIGVFALTYVLTLKAGGSLLRVMGVYLLIQPAVTLLCLVLVYAVTVVLGRVSPAAFARAAAPAQIVAVSTRSSLAALPAMISGSRAHLQLAPAAADFLLPLSVSIFRISEVITNPVKLIFLAHVYGVALEPAAIVSFIVTIMIFSVTEMGTPNNGGGIAFRTVPVFLAAGIPLEGVIILAAVDAIPDIFDTLANVTGQMSATTILSARTAAQ
jgi:proton glutamate symport protein